MRRIIAGIWVLAVVMTVGWLAASPMGQAPAANQDAKKALDAAEDAMGRSRSAGHVGQPHRCAARTAGGVWKPRVHDRAGSR